MTVISEEITFKYFMILCICLFVLWFYRPVNSLGSGPAQSDNLPNNKFTGQAKSSKRLTSIVHILLPETGNCPSKSAEGRVCLFV